MHALLKSPLTEVTGLIPVNDETLYVSSRYTEASYEPLNTADVVIDAFVTAQARLKLYSYLEKLGGLLCIVILTAPSMQPAIN